MSKTNKKYLLTIAILGGMLLAGCISSSEKPNTFVCNPPCGPLPSGENNCLIIQDSIYTSCEKDSDCLEGESCRLLQCHYGDVVMEERRGCTASN